MRKPLVAGNWKMNGSRTMIAGLLDGLTAGLTEGCDKTEIAVFPPSIYLSQVKDALDGSSVAWGVQNVCTQEGEAGAYTGETAVAMAADFGCAYVLVGHSERRALYAESDAVVAAKFALIAGQNLVPVLCVGETLEERERGETMSVVSRQLGAVLDGVDAALLNDFVIAYEPVWAIGTGKTATPQQAQDVHAEIRGLLEKRCPDMAARTRILYGGSVKASNAVDILGQLDVDGALVGGASLKAEEFLAICRAAG
ncbi:triose-phosphate isomerase [Kistimonas scapharcae]|uniref:Triosephosphate isomerase n=1 Tax=Kistimonas scapharcae TaxID=1036133 RepID=A0ABP8V0F1_9GAMM